MLSDTVQVAFQNQINSWEDQLTTFMHDHGAAVQSGAPVPDAILQSLISNPVWADTANQTWLDSSLQTITTDAAQAHYGMGLIYSAEGDKDKARTEFTRALLLKPTYSDATTALQGLQQ